jgi:hypothetical protein
MNKRAASLLILVLGVALFIFRGPLRGMKTDGFNDFGGTYTIAKAWLSGLNPYSAPEAVRIWLEDGRPAWLFVLKLKNSEAMPGAGSGLPGCVPYIAPFALLPAFYADRVWIWFGSIALALMIWKLFPPARFPPAVRYSFMALAFALAPLHTGAKGGNASTLVIACLGFSYLWRFDRPILAGILLGIAGCFKPHVAGAALVFMIVERTWTPVLTSIVTGLLSVAVFVVRLSIAHVEWWSVFMKRMFAVGYPGGPDDFSLLNPARYQLVNLQVLFSSVVSNRTVVNAAAIAFVLVLTGLWFYLVLKHRVQPILAFSALNVILLLPSYHRINDAGVIVFTVCAAALAWSQDMPYRKTMTALLLPFVLPLPTAVVQLSASGYISASLVQNKAFIIFVLCHEVWLLVALVVVHLLVMAREPRRTTHESYATSPVTTSSAIANV